MELHRVLQASFELFSRRKLEHDGPPTQSTLQCAIQNKQRRVKNKA